MKKILLLGGSRYLLPVIKAIHKLGHLAITCDYLPDNIAHKYSDEYYNISIVDKDAVLKLAESLKIDGIMSFACDPGVNIAAYVAEKLGLQTHPYEAVRILQNKALFRKFLEEHNFNVPKAKSYTVSEQAIQEANLFHWPVIVKPTDSAGSKGVTKVNDITNLKEAAEYAITFSTTKSFIVEEFIEQEGFSSDSDCFSIDGKLVYCSFSNQRFDNEAANPYTPSAYSWPSTMSEDIQKSLRSELQRLFILLNLKTSIFNIETRLGIDGKPYIMEVSPRGGGNRIAEVLHYATGVDLITNAVKAVLNEKIVEISADPQYDGAWAEIILHSPKNGKFENLKIDSTFESNYVIEKDLWINQDEYVHEFTGANFAIGTLILKFRNQSELTKYMQNISNYVQVVVK